MAKYVLPYRTTKGSSPTLREVPEGWTTDPSFMSSFVKGQWAKVAKRCSLKDPVPIMCTTPESGDHYGLITAGGRYYFTGDLDWCIYKILKPTTLDEILRKISEDNEKSITTKLLEKEESEEDPEEEEKLRAEIVLMEQMEAEPGYLVWEQMESD